MFVIKDGGLLSEEKLERYAGVFSLDRSVWQTALSMSGWILVIGFYCQTNSIADRYY